MCRFEIADKWMVLSYAIFRFIVVFVRICLYRSDDCYRMSSLSKCSWKPSRTQCIHMVLMHAACARYHLNVLQVIPVEFTNKLLNQLIGTALVGA